MCLCVYNLSQHIKELQINNEREHPKKTVLAVLTIDSRDRSHVHLLDLQLLIHSGQISRRDVESTARKESPGSLRSHQKHSIWEVGTGAFARSRPGGRKPVGFSDCESACLFVGRGCAAAALPRSGGRTEGRTSQSLNWE